MSDTENRGGTPEENVVTSEPDPAHEGTIARLLRLAGARPEVSADRTARVREVVHARWRTAVRGRRRRRLLVWVAVPATLAAALLVAIGLGGWLRRSRPAPLPGPIATLERLEGRVREPVGGLPVAGAALRIGTTLSTGDDGRAALRLLSGPSVRLDNDTTLRLASPAILELSRGAVYVDSGGEPRTGLEVRTPEGVVRDVGTQFQVRLPGAGLRLSVREGTASLAFEGGRYEARAGTRLTVGARGDVSRETVSPHGPEWGWILDIAPAFDLEGRTLGDFLDWVSRENGWQVRFTDPSIERETAAVLLHGSIDGLRPDQAPAAVLPTCGLSSRLERDVLYVEPLDDSRRSP